MKKETEYEGLTTTYKDRLAKLNKKVWGKCLGVLRNQKSYEVKVLKKEINVFIDLLEQSYKESDYRKFDALMELIERNLLLIPIRFLTMEGISKLEQITGDPISYYKVHDQLINDEPPL